MHPLQVRTGLGRVLLAQVMEQHGAVGSLGHAESSGQDLTSEPAFEARAGPGLLGLGRVEGLIVRWSRMVSVHRE